MDDVGLKMLHRHCPWSNINTYMGTEALLLEPNPGVPVLDCHYPWSNIYSFGVEALLLEPNPGVPVLDCHYPWSNIYIFGVEALLLEPNPGVPVLYRHYPWYNTYIFGVEALLLECQNLGVTVLYQRCVWYSIQIYESTTMMPLNMNLNMKQLTHLTSSHSLEHLIDHIAITNLVEFSSVRPSGNVMRYFESFFNVGNINYLYVHYSVLNKPYQVIWFDTSDQLDIAYYHRSKCFFNIIDWFQMMHD